MVIAAYDVMAIWCREPLQVSIALVADRGLEVGQAVPARERRLVGTLFAGPSERAQWDPAMRRRTGR